MSTAELYSFVPGRILQPPLSRGQHPLSTAAWQRLLSPPHPPLATGAFYSSVLQLRSWAASTAACTAALTASPATAFRSSSPYQLPAAAPVYSPSYDRDYSSFHLQLSRAVPHSSPLSPRSAHTGSAARATFYTEYTAPAYSGDDYYNSSQEQPPHSSPLARRPQMRVNYSFIRASPPAAAAHARRRNTGGAA
jgi:hypothetical protein